MFARQSKPHRFQACNAAGCGHGTCSSLWQSDFFDSNDGIDYSITIADGLVYVCTPNGSIHALRP